MLYRLLIILSLCLSLSCWGRTIEFEHLSVANGISQNSGLAITEDHWGKIWIGTEDGLNVYDGVRIKSYLPDKTNKHSLLGRKVRDLVVYEKELWVATTLGISRYREQTNDFIQYPIKDIESLGRLDDQLFIGSSKDGLKVYTVKGYEILLKSEYKNLGIVNDIYIGDDKSLWICTNQGVYRKYTSQSPTLVIKGNFKTLHVDVQKRLWIGSENNGVHLYTKDFQAVKNFNSKTYNSNSIVSNIIRDISEDNSGNIWIGTFMGLSIVDGNSLEVTNYQHSKNNTKGLSHNSIYSIHKDSDNNMWVGTYFGGVNYYNPNHNIYTFYNDVGSDPDQISFQVISSMVEDDSGNLWIGTDGGGLMYFDRKTYKFTHHKFDGSYNSISHNNIKSLLLSRNQDLFIGTHLGGLNIFDIKHNNFKAYRNNPAQSNSLPNNITMTIVKYGIDYIVGTYAGIHLFSPIKETFTPLLNESQNHICGKRITVLYIDSQQKLWIGTEYNGLFVYDLNSKILTKQNLEPIRNDITNNAEITAIMEDHKYRLWIGTSGGGLFRYDHKLNNYTNYTVKNDNLLSDVIRGIAESRYGGIWISSNKGLTLMNTEKKEYFNYGVKSGFPLTEISPRSILMTSDGELFVGGINGLVSFKEQDLLLKEQSLFLHFSELSVNNKLIEVGDASNILNQSLPYTNRIILEPHHHTFSINFSTNNYDNFITNSFQYILEGFSNEWQEINANALITFTNLNPGHYTLKLRAFNKLKRDIIGETNLQIVVNPPLYKTWYAYVFYLIVAVALIILANKVYLTKIRLESNLYLEKREREKQKELNQAKLNFFTNISHEFRTPLTLIIGTIEGLLEDHKTSTLTYKKILSINKNAAQLKKLISELLDFRKAEEGHLKLKVNQCSINEFMEEIIANFEEYAKGHNINLEFTPLTNDITVWIDPEQMEKVFYNLLSNAFKFVNEFHGIIKVDIKESPNHLIITVSDNGPGIQDALIGRVFDEYYQLEQWDNKKQSLGSGIGLALCKCIVTKHQGTISVTSSEGRGSSFIVNILKNNNHFTKKQLLESRDWHTEKYNIIDEIETNKERLPEPTDKSLNMLVVEDNNDIRHMICEIFQSQYIIIEASDGKIGMQMALDNNPDIIISDVMMPNMSGTQMCTQLKRNINTSHIPIILLTARTAVEQKIEGLETGADDYIVKPFNIKLLKARVHNLLQNRRLLQEKFQNSPSNNISEITFNSIDKEILDNALYIVEQNLTNENFCIDIFAQEMGLGRTRLFSKLKGVTGQTPNDFILTVRMKKALALLLTNNTMNISDIAYATGFKTPDYFGKCFKNHFGMSPSAYVKQHLKNKPHID